MRFGPLSVSRLRCSTSGVCWRANGQEPPFVTQFWILRSGRSELLPAIALWLVCGRYILENVSQTANNRNGIKWGAGASPGSTGGRYEPTYRRGIGNF